jgi:hypothetical protein
VGAALWQQTSSKGIVSGSRALFCGIPTERRASFVEIIRFKHEGNPRQT